MTPPLIGNYSPDNNNLCDQNQVSSIDGIAQDLQQNPMSPMPTAQQPAPQSAAQPNPQQARQQNQLNEIPNMVDPNGVPLQQNMNIDPYRRSGRHSLLKQNKLIIKKKCRETKLKLNFTVNTEMYRNNVPANNYGIPAPNIVNGHHHDMQMNNFGQSDVTNGYGMNLKQEPDVNF